MELTFFGLTPDYRQLIFRQIHDIVFYGRGGFTWETVYNMPIWLRKFTSKTIEQQITEEYEAQQKASKEASGIQEATPENTNNVQVPEAVRKASYTTTVSKKQ